MLAAAAARTKRIRLTSAVTVLSSDDPVRVFQQFATLDLLSGGRAEIMAGRGSFIESFPLFGHDLDDYDELFAEKLELLLSCARASASPGRARTAPPLDDVGVYPRPLQDPLPVWVAVGGTPQSVVRAGTLGLPLALAIIGGQPGASRRWSTSTAQAAARAGHDPAPCRSASTCTATSPRRPSRPSTTFPPYAAVMTQLGRERGWPPMSRAQFDAMRGPGGSLAVGSPEEVTAKLVRVQRLLGLDRVLLHLSVGTMPHAAVLRAVELLGTEVAPAVRDAAAAAPPTRATASAGPALRGRRPRRQRRLHAQDPRRQRAAAPSSSARTATPPRGRAARG